MRRVRAMQLQSRTHAATGSALQRVAVFGTDDRVALPAKYKDVQQKIGLLFNMRSVSYTHLTLPTILRV